MKKIFFLVLFFTLLIVPLTASAQFNAANTELGKVGGNTGLATSLEDSLSTIIKGALSLVGTIFLLLTVYAGYLWMTASGNEEKVTKAKDIATQTIIGLAITLSAYAITAFVTGKLAGNSTPSPSGGLTDAQCTAINNNATCETGPTCNNGGPSLGACATTGEICCQ